MQVKEPQGFFGRVLDRYAHHHNNDIKPYA
jgi:hypothetical protein